jgi:hypothetical protein
MDEEIIAAGSVIDTTPIKLKLTGGGFRRATDGLSETHRAEIFQLAQWTGDATVLTLIFLRSHGGSVSDEQVAAWLPLVREAMDANKNPG